MCCLLLCETTIAAPADDKPDNAKLILGVWEATKAGKDTLGVGALAEFAKEGKLKITAQRDGMTVLREGTYKITGDKLTVVLKTDDKEVTHNITIKKLTETELVTSDDRGAIEFKRKK